jgi:hypothetical protein
MVILHRLGKKYTDVVKKRTWEPGEPFKVRHKRRLEYLKHTNPVAFRELAEETLIELVGYLVNQSDGEPVELAQVVREASYKIGVSPETVKRYVFTHSATGAELSMVGKRVKLNPFFKAEEDEDDDE